MIYILIGILDCETEKLFNRYSTVVQKKNGKSTKEKIEKGLKATRNKNKKMEK